MSDDIVNRLRDRVWTFPEAEDISVLDSSMCSVMDEAAAEIERLRAGLEREREREASALHHHEWRECEGVIAEQKAEIERLRRLRSEAIEVLDGWRRVYEAVEKRPADLGRFDFEIVLDRIAEKDDEIERLRDGIAQALIELDAEHWCLMCEDGSGPCATRLVADDLRALIEEDDDGEARS